MDMQETIRRWVQAHEEELARDAARLVRIPSVSEPSQGAQPYGSGCAQVLSAFLELAEGYGLKTSHFENRVGRLELAGGSGPCIGLWGHLDVVPEGGGWLYPPYGAKRTGDFLIGRGAQDNKGPCVAAMYALRCLQELDRPLRHRFCMLAGCSEETGMDDVERYLAANPAPDYSIVADCGFPVCHGEKGLGEVELVSRLPLQEVIGLTAGTVSNVVPDEAQMTLRAVPRVRAGLRALPEEISSVEEEGRITLCAKGLSKHSAFPQGSLNALHLLLHAVCEAGLLQGEDARILESAARLSGGWDGKAAGIACEDSVSGPLTCVCAVARLKEGRAALTFNIRYPVTADGKEWLQKMEKSAQGWELRVLHLSGGYYMPPDTPLVESLMRSYRAATGDMRPPYVMGGGTYARRIPNAVAFGPGLPYDLSPLGLPDGHGGAHAPDEALHIPSLMKALEIYVQALLALDEDLG